MIFDYSLPVSSPRPAVLPDLRAAAARAVLTAFPHRSRKL